MSETSSESTRRIKSRCPNCQHRVSTSIINVGRRGRCPKCQRVFRIHLKANRKTKAKRPHPAKPTVVSNDTVSDLLRQRRASTPSLIDALRSLSLSSLSSDQLKTLIVVSCLLFLVVLIRGDYRLGVISLILGNLPVLIPAMVMVALLVHSVHKVRRLRQIIYFSIWLHVPWFTLYPLIIGTLFEDLASFFMGLMSTILVGVPWFCFGHWPARWATPYLLSLFVHRLRCPACRDDIEIRGRWQCSCGYIDHRDDRSILLFLCPKCHERMGYTQCPRCDTTILI